jgi:hypothetical protein
MSAAELRAHDRFDPLSQRSTQGELPESFTRWTEGYDVRFIVKRKPRANNYSIGWIVEIEGKKYGNWLTMDDMTCFHRAVEVLVKNAKDSIALIKPKAAA